MIQGLGKGRRWVWRPDQPGGRAVNLNLLCMAGEACVFPIQQEVREHQHQSS